MAVLLIVEMVVDKVPAADHVNDVVNTLVRPTAGALLMVAVSGNAEGVQPACSWSRASSSRAACTREGDGEARGQRHHGGHGRRRS